MANHIGNVLVAMSGILFQRRLVALPVAKYGKIPVVFRLPVDVVPGVRTWIGTAALTTSSTS